VNLSLAKGEQIAIVGASGSGKSTLLHLLGGLDKPSKGEVLIDGVNIHQLNETNRCHLRNQKLGFVYQLHHLLPEFTVFENVCMPLMLGKMNKKEAADRANDVLNKVGLSHRLLHKLGEISGGERQRTAIARALVTNPVCVLADEPTGNLDNKTAETVYELMLTLNQEYQTSFIIVTHDLRLASRMDRILLLENGELGIFDKQ
jgi:lipoprotein-releasing system ATP-binding protein